MSDDLISRKALLGKLVNCKFDRASIICDEDGFPMYISIIGMKKIIKDAPSAFDKEKVIEELTAGRFIYAGEDVIGECTSIGINKAIRIVEKGGIE